MKRISFKTVFPFLGLATVIILFTILTGGALFTSRNLQAVFNNAFSILIATSAFVFVMSVGNLDLSISAVMAVSCVCAATAARVSPILALPVAILVGIILGFVNAAVDVHLGLGSLIGTMATQYIFTGILTIILQGGTISAPISMLKWNTMPLKIGTLIVVIVVLWYVFNYTVYGKQCRAVGSCPEAARLSGISVKTVKSFTYVIMGAALGLCAFFSLIRTGSASSGTGSDLLMNVWCAALLGGLPITGGASTKFRAAIIGSLTMAFLANGMTLMGIGEYDTQLIKGIVFLVAIAISFDRKNQVVIK